MNSIFAPEYKALITLPQRNDTDTEIYSEYSFKSGELVFGGQKFVFPEGFSVGVNVRWLEEGLLIAGISINAVIEAECARCLKSVSLEISGELMYLYYSHGAEGFDDSEYMPVEVDYFSKVLDVWPQIQESIYTLLPVKVLCRSDCKGLCPVCGQDLNEGTCSCHSEEIDPRLDALRNYVFEGE